MASDTSSPIKTTTSDQTDQGLVVAETQEVTATNTEVGHQDDAHGAFPPFDPTTVPSQLLWLVISFGVLYLMMSRMVLPRIAEILEVRRDRIEGGLADARRLEEETSQTIANYEAAVEEAHQKANAIAQKERDALNEEMAGHKAKVDEELNAKLAESEARITKMREDAMKNIDTIAIDAASEIVSGVLGKKPKAADVKKAVKAALSS